MTAFTSAHAQRSGGDNTIDAEVLDGGGGLSGAGSLGLVGSLGSTFGTSSAPQPSGPPETLKLWGGFVGQLALPSIYTDDGIDDSWQESFFGFNNPDGLPEADPDGDGVNNLGEFFGGTDPTDPKSFFTLSIEFDNVNPDHVRIRFSPFLLDRTYTLTTSPDLDDNSFSDHPSIPGGTPGLEGSFLDTDNLNERFYSIRIEMN